MKPCAHCGSKATETWDLRPCALGRKRRYDLCLPCDIELNELVLRFVNEPKGDAMLTAYRQRAMSKPANITSRDAERAVKKYLSEKAA